MTADIGPALLASRDVYTVSRLNREARAVLETGFPLLWVEGEISNLAQPRSGHLYFSLKDEAAQVRCAMFRNRNLYLDFAPENGMQVLARGRVSLYEDRGEFQLVVEHMEAAGDGALRRAFEALKQRLGREGLFDAARKRPLPTLPCRIGVVTSPTGAAIRDILTILGRRFPTIPVVVYPVPVQGVCAAPEIVRTLGLAADRAECDVLILARGGGSLEDLWAFNDEPLARAIAACPIPIVTGIGHETDFTIADFVADQRASTPSAAAELVTPDRTELLARLGRLRGRLEDRARELIGRRRIELGGLDTRLHRQHPERRLEAVEQRLDELEQRLVGAVRRLHLRLGERHGYLAGRLRRQHPAERLRVLDERLEALEQHLVQAQLRRSSAAQTRLASAHARLMARQPLPDIERRRQELERLGRRLAQARATAAAMMAQRLAALAGRLEGASPLGILARGYAVVTRERDGTLVRAADQVSEGEGVHVRLARGALRCSVEGRSEES